MGGPNRSSDYMGVAYPWERPGAEDVSREGVWQIAGSDERPDTIIDAEFADPGVDEPPVKELPVWLL